MADDKKEFVVKDRRIFSDDSEDHDQKEEQQETATVEKTSKETTDKDEAEPAKDAPPLPEINFATFIFSLNSSVLVHLGMLEDPATGQKQKNLPLAKQTIDILGMLEEKTKGNLTEDEATLLKNILYDLRMIYVKETS